MAKIAVLLVLLFTTSAVAQEKPRPEMKATAGWVGFLDEDMVDHGVFGGAVRYYLTPRIGIEPEVLYMRGPGSDRDLTVIPHISFDFLKREKVQPYVIGGAGWLRHTNRFGPLKFTHDEWVVNGGLGVKVFITPRFFVAPEFRMGLETIMRITGSAGFVF